MPEKIHYSNYSRQLLPYIVLLQSAFCVTVPHPVGHWYLGTCIDHILHLSVLILCLRCLTVLVPIVAYEKISKENRISPSIILRHIYIYATDLVSSSIISLKLGLEVRSIVPERSCEHKQWKTFFGHVQICNKSVFF